MSRSGYSDLDDSPRKCQLASKKSTEDIHARQPTIYSSFQYNPSEDFRLLKRIGLILLPMNIVRNAL